MAAIFPAEEIRLVQEATSVSAANADSLALSTPVPAGKIWNIETISYFPSVAETQSITFQKITRSGGTSTILNPISLALSPTMQATPLEQGMTIQLYPGEYLVARRATHTAGSTMSTFMQFVESDLPLYRYIDPQTAARLKTAGTKMAEVVAGVGGGGAGGGGGPAPIHGGRSRPPAR